ncbi:hypothetical protein SAMD00019534_014390 [Acytostelium subglobosum LB1]|uniref:hypothetical protein n=1 Tax=Acytostelium subglobosum LB1 TaxID=1410327 RepID=UPI0006448526|nr:hypothetical protein SAMD00019534_014390 [Acytostelium subglobosum LB1]GAM18264.1 hypothetical protein SAMD00019534_014390 [Acytostelium subglobosum LB1]|eukprot:XP_012758860.1 hypothetical protein SAMD00019534_014390 [Acytostelium subglobosum LB1]
MVYGLIVHALPSVAGAATTTSDNSAYVYCSQYYSSEGNNDLMAQRQTAIVQRVISDHQFKYVCDNTKPDEKLYPDWAVAHIQRVKEQNAILQSTMTPSSTSSSSQAARTSDSGSREGVFRIVPPKFQTTPNITPQNDPIAPVAHYFATSKYVIWKQMLGACFTIICEEDENRLLVANFLAMFNNILLDHFKNIISKSPVQESEEILLLLHHYLPNGQLLFTSNQYAKHTKATIPQQQ